MLESFDLKNMYLKKITIDDKTINVFRREGVENQDIYIKIIPRGVGMINNDKNILQGGKSVHKSLEKYSVSELREKAKSKKITGYSKMLKAELIAAINAKRIVKKGGANMCSDSKAENQAACLGWNPKCVWDNTKPTGFQCLGSY